MRGSSEPIRPLERALLLSTTAMLDSACAQSLFPADLGSGLPGVPRQDQDPTSCNQLCRYGILGWNNYQAAHGPVMQSQSFCFTSAIHVALHNVACLVLSATHVIDRAETRASATSDDVNG